MIQEVIGCMPAEVASMEVMYNDSTLMGRHRC